MDWTDYAVDPDVDLKSFVVLDSPVRKICGDGYRDDPRGAVLSPLQPSLFKRLLHKLFGLGPCKWEGNGVKVRCRVCKRSGWRMSDTAVWIRAENMRHCLYCRECRPHWHFSDKCVVCADTLSMMLAHTTQTARLHRENAYMLNRRGAAMAGRELPPNKLAMELRTIADAIEHH